MSRTSSPTTSTGTLHDRVASVLELIRPSIQSDGGDIELIGVDAAGVVSIRFRGACLGCPSSNMTLKIGLEDNLRHNVPEVTTVIAVP